MLTRSRGWKAKEEDTSYHRPGAWEGLFEDEEKLPPSANHRSRIGELGQQGWELVSVVAESSNLGGMGVTSGSIIAASGHILGESLDYAGYTTHEKWIFRRPIEP